MLTATYSLVALSVEHNKALCDLIALQQTIQFRAANLRHSDPADMEGTVRQLMEFDRYCHNRKFEYVIPAVRKATCEADGLLLELEALDTRAMLLVGAIRDGMRSVLEHGMARLEELCRSMQLYCRNVFQRLMKEGELLRIAQRVIPLEEWFNLAASFLSCDAEAAKHKRYRCYGPRPVLEKA